jgi:hypothetical protein
LSQNKSKQITVFCLFIERKKAPTPSKEIEKQKDEESWPLKDVIFVEDIKTVPVGKVLKVGSPVIKYWKMFSVFIYLTV